jgi:hypothetical protein
MRNAPWLAIGAFFLAATSHAATRLYTAEDPRVQFSSPMMGPIGPMGAGGPLSTIGPIGSNIFNPSTFFEALGDWTGMAKLLSANGGPLSADGPLGPNGPIGNAYSSFSSSLRADGVYGILGPAGPFGPLGPLGPLGPVGAHGHVTRTGGGFGGDHLVTVPGGVGDGRFHLVDWYPNGADGKSLGTSFMLVDSVLFGDNQYNITSPDDQVVSVLVVPEKGLDIFGINITGRGMNASSESLLAINWVTLRMRAGESVAVHVHLMGSAQVYSKSYRLVVVGAGPGR